MLKLTILMTGKIFTPDVVLHFVMSLEKKNTQLVGFTRYQFQFASRIMFCDYVCSVGLLQ